MKYIIHLYSFCEKRQPLTLYFSFLFLYRIHLLSTRNLDINIQKASSPTWFAVSVGNTTMTYYRQGALETFGKDFFFSLSPSSIAAAAAAWRKVRSEPSL